MTTPQTIDQYLAGVSGEMRAVLEDLRRTITAAAPEAEEAISYGMPAFRYRSRTLVYFSAFKTHCSFFPASVAVMDRMGEELVPFRTSKGTLRFTPDNPIPKRLIRKVVMARVAEIDAARR